MHYATDQSSTQSWPRDFGSMCFKLIVDFALEVTSVFKYLKEGAKRMKPSFSHWFTVARPEAIH